MVRQTFFEEGDNPCGTLGIAKFQHLNMQNCVPKAFNFQSVRMEHLTEVPRSVTFLGHPFPTAACYKTKDLS